MLLVLFILFGFQHQIQCNSAFRYPQDNRTIHNWRKNELQVRNDDYGGVPSGAKSNAKEQGFGVSGKTAPAPSAADTFQKNIDFIDESRVPKPPAPLHSVDDPLKHPRAPHSPVFRDRLKRYGKRKHKVGERVYQAAPEKHPALTPPQAVRAISRLLAKQPKNLMEELEQRKARLNAEVAGPQMRVDVGPPPPVFAYGSSEQEDDEVVLAVPDPNMLDMAQAVGGHLPSMRYKNRLCSRHVLLPEGPKYDSRGATYLPAYSPKPLKDNGSTHDYAVTRAPRLVLPKCCNCCKKSVLGCE